jgi:hypothetical protein
LKIIRFVTDEAVDWEKLQQEFPNRTFEELLERAEYLANVTAEDNAGEEGGTTQRISFGSDFTVHNLLQSASKARSSLSSSSSALPMDKTPSKSYSFNPWTNEEDSLLMTLLTTLKAGPRLWNKLAKHFPNRSKQGVIAHVSRFMKKHKIILQQPTEEELAAEAEEPDDDDDQENIGNTQASGNDVFKVKTVWTFAEEEKLLDAMLQQQGSRKWDEIASLFPGRSKRAVECHGLKLIRDIQLATARENSQAAMQTPNSSATTGEGTTAHTLTASACKDLSLLAPTPDKTNILVEHLYLLKDPKSRRQKIFWTQEEEERLLLAMEEHAPKGKQRWIEIATLFPDRSVAAVEAHGISLEKRLLKEQARLQQSIVAHGLEAAVHGSTSSSHRTSSGRKSRNPYGASSDYYGYEEEEREIGGEEEEELEGDIDEEDVGDDIEGGDGSRRNSRRRSSLPNPIVHSPGGVGEEDGMISSKLAAYRQSKAYKISRSKTWTPEEDAQLRLAMSQVNGNHWSKVALLVPGKTPQQCLGRWRTLNPTINRTPWTEEVR